MTSQENIVVPYGRSTLSARVPHDCNVTYALPKEGAPVDADSVLYAALAAPGARSELAEVLSPREGKRSVIIVNDGTRPTPTAQVLSLLGRLHAIDAAAIAGGRLSVLVATGAHGAGTDQDLDYILGREGRRLFEGAVQWHNSRDREGLVFLGTTAAGTPVWLNRLVVEADAIMVINSVEPHYFAGYTGGRKSLVPGVAGFPTIEANHKLALDPAADVLRLDDNPVHNDLLQAVSFIDAAKLFSLQLVLDRDQQIAAAYAGALADSFAAAVAAANQQFVVQIPAAADIAVTAAAPPMDYDLYQSQKALDNAARAVRPGGALVLVSRCRHGVGDRAYFDLLASSEGPDAALQHIAANYRLGYHKAARLATLALRYHVLAVTDLPAQQVQSVFMTPCRSLTEALESARRRACPASHILVLPDGCLTVPTTARTD